MGDNACPTKTCYHASMATTKTPMPKDQVSNDMPSCSAPLFFVLWDEPADVVNRLQGIRCSCSSMDAMHILLEENTEQCGEP
jgi:hypothetical protein